MKKHICIIVCISTLLSIFNLSVSAVTQNNPIDTFINGATNLIQKYDINKTNNTTPKIKNNFDLISEASTSNVTEYTRFQTCRLIVQADYDFDTYNAIDVVSGFQNFHILQFENEEDTQAAYENYVNDSNIISVDIDKVFNINDFSLLGRNDPVYTRGEFHDCWSLNATGMDIVKEHFKNDNLPEIVVGVLDSGIDLDHEIFENRIKRTYFNSSVDGVENDESDDDGHGTMVSSTIVNQTNENIKIAMYRIINSDGSGTTVASNVAVLRAVSDGIKIINMSYAACDDAELEKATIEYAHDNGVFVIAAAGNRHSNLGRVQATQTMLSGYACVVAANTAQKFPAEFTNYGELVDIIAPGENVRVAVNGGTYSSSSGTSFSAPIITGIYAMMCSIYPTMPVEKKMRLLTGTATPLTEPYTEHSFDCGVVNAVEIFDLVDIEAPKFSLEGGTYIGEVSIEITAEEGCDIYYTIDQTYPSPTNGTLYTEPVRYISDGNEVTAVAYKNGKRSNFYCESFYSAEVGTDDLFTITDDGIITSYSGDINLLKIPETINGITVKNIAEGVFAETDLFGLVLPDTMTSIGNAELWGGYSGESFIKGNQNIYYIGGKNIKILGQYAFQDCLNLYEVNFPNCEIIGNYAFMSSGIPGCKFDNVKTLSSEAFFSANYIREIYLPNCTEMLDRTFQNSSELRYIYAPKIDMAKTSPEYPGELLDPDFEGIDQTFNNTIGLFEIDFPLLRVVGFSKNHAGKNTFYNCCARRFEFSKLEYFYELPYPDDKWYSSYYLPITVELSLPATLKYAASVESYLDPENHNYCVYGTKGTYAEQWATDNAIPFYEITQETAIVENIEPFWDKYSYNPLEFDARGFNRTYQWYGSDDNAVGNDTPIIGATEKIFNPDENKQYPYYYCVMNSKDIDIDGNVINEVNITSDICQNRLYYVYDIAGTTIDYSQFLIYTTKAAQKNIESIIGIPEKTLFDDIPSYIYKTHRYYGTGSQLELHNDDNTISYYTIIVQGDVNGDSAVDVLDAVEVQRASTNHIELTDDYLLAADTNFDGQLDVTDYAQVVNLVLNS